MPGVLGEIFNIEMQPRRPEVPSIWRDDQHQVGACDSSGDWIVGIVDELGEPIDCLVGFNREVNFKCRPHWRYMHIQFHIRRSDERRIRRAYQIEGGIGAEYS